MFQNLEKHNLTAQTQNSILTAEGMKELLNSTVVYLQGIITCNIIFYKFYFFHIQYLKHCILVLKDPLRIYLIAFLRKNTNLKNINYPIHSRGYFFMINMD